MRRSLIYTRKSNGPKLLSCGTSHVTDADDDKQPLTLHFRSNKVETIRDLIDLCRKFEAFAAIFDDQ